MGCATGNSEYCGACNVVLPRPHRHSYRWGRGFNHVVISRLALYEGEQVRIDDISMGGERSVGVSRINLERRIFQKLG